MLRVGAQGSINHHFHACFCGAVANCIRVDVVETEGIIKASVVLICGSRGYIHGCMIFKAISRLALWAVGQGILVCPGRAWVVFLNPGIVLERPNGRHRDKLVSSILGGDPISYQLFQFLKLTFEVKVKNFFSDSPVLPSVSSNSLSEAPSLNLLESTTIIVDTVCNLVFYFLGMLSLTFTTEPPPTLARRARGAGVPLEGLAEPEITK